MKKFLENIKNLRVAHHYSQADVARIVGVTKQAVSQWEQGLRFPRVGVAQKLADLYNVSLSDLFDIDGTPLPPNGFEVATTVTRPVVGTIACGEPILATENIDEYVDVPANIKCDFLLRCKGDSMIGARIYDGDLVYIRQQPTVEDGEIAAVLIGEEATLKRVQKAGNHMLLIAENPAYPVMVLDSSSADSVRIIGKAVGCLFQL